jgi:hypothetical protein
MVVGGGFIGSEIAAATVHERREGHDDLPIGVDRIARLPESLARFLTDYYREQGN